MVSSLILLASSVGCLTASAHSLAASLGCPVISVSLTAKMEDLTAEEKVESSAEEEAGNSADDEAQSSAEDEYEAKSSAEEEKSLAESDKNKTPHIFSFNVRQQNVNVPSLGVFLIKASRSPDTERL